MVVICLLVIAISTLSACAENYGDELPFRSYLNSEDTQYALKTTENEMRIDIYSESGIGEAQFDINSDAFPAKVVFRLHLNGLESLRLTANEGATIHAFVSRQDDNAIYQSVLIDNQEQLIDADSRYWLDITPVESAEGQIVYFDVRPPARSGRRNFSLAWIDFYR